ncbi:MAG: homocysteine S-methyltransferase family protein [Chloroflexi bacterium]|nr:homocysteine S-methyltransferase family protein [Chloroflexota bacterium]
MTDTRTTLIETLRSRSAGTLLADGGIGSLIFQLTGRLATPEYAYETLNLSNRELVKGIHYSSLAAGARVITTNTFAANTAELINAGVGDQVDAINRAAVAIAREAIAEYALEYSIPGSEMYVIGSIGPGGRMRDAYDQQIESLIESGIDGILLETFTDIELALQLVEYASGRPDAPPVIVHGALDPGLGETRKWPTAPAEFVDRAAGAGASVVGINCVAPWVAAAFIEEAKTSSRVKSGDVLLSAMPNAGGFERIGHRFLARANPEYMGNLARQLGDAGASLVGGCCEVHPEHLREMSAYLKSRNSSFATNKIATSGVNLGSAKIDPSKKDRRRSNGSFSRKLLDGEFVVSVEIVAPTGADMKALDLRANTVGQIADERLADAVDITDGSRGLPLVPPGVLVELIRQKLNWKDRDRVEFIPHFTGRDLSTLAVQSRLMGYHLRGLRNVLFITGDPPKMSPTYPRSSAVFDMDSVQMIRATAGQLNQGRDFGGNPLGTEIADGPDFTIGTGFEPESLNLPRELGRLQTKIDAGADYVMTQPVFNTTSLSAIEPYREAIPVIPGVMVLRSSEHAARIAQIPGVNVPRTILNDIARFERSEDQAKVGLDLAVAQARSYKSEGWSGLYLMSPASMGAAVGVLKALAE